MEDQTLALKFSETPWQEYDGGRVKIADKKNFNAPDLDITVAHLWLAPSSLRTLHWHKTGESDSLYSSTLTHSIPS